MGIGFRFCGRVHPGVLLFAACCRSGTRSDVIATVKAHGGDKGAKAIPAPASWISEVFPAALATGTAGAFEGEIVSEGGNW
jgi:hypothetical protein